MAIQPKYYETLYLVRPDINSDDLTIIQDKVTKAINSGKGEISRDEKWAERDLAYPIDDYTRGTYYIVEFKALPNVIANIEKHLAFHNVDVLRFMTVSIEEPSAKAADAPAPAAPKATPKESTPASSAPPAPSTPPSATAAASPKAERTPEAPSAAPADTPAEESTPEAPSAPESAPAPESNPETATPPESAPGEDTSASDSSSGFTAAPPLSSTEDKDSGGEK